jgi:membrane-associated phospholipid phosphatase
MRRGWFSDHDLSVREERPAFLLSALAAAGLAALGAQLAHAPPVVRVSTLAGLVATAFVTALTAAGLKVSGHVAVPVGVLALLAGSSQRGLWPFAVAALAVSWARVREGRHTPREVIVGWGVAGASGLVARWGF